MEERRCRYCQQTFLPRAGCGARIRHVNGGGAAMITGAADAEYRQGCRDSSRKWRVRHHDYWKRRRQDHPEVAEHNRQP
jgi:hypothetical protein